MFHEYSGRFTISWWNRRIAHLIERDNALTEGEKDYVYLLCSKLDFFLSVLLQRCYSWVNCRIYGQNSCERNQLSPVCKPFIISSRWSSSLSLFWFYSSPLSKCEKSWWTYNSFKRCNWDYSYHTLCFSSCNGWCWLQAPKSLFERKSQNKFGKYDQKTTFRKKSLLFHSTFMTLNTNYTLKTSIHNS